MKWILPTLLLTLCGSLTTALAQYPKASAAAGCQPAVSVTILPPAPPPTVIRYVPSTPRFTIVEQPAAVYYPSAPMYLYAAPTWAPTYSALPAITVLPRKQYATPLRDFLFGRY